MAILPMVSAQITMSLRETEYINQLSELPEKVDIIDMVVPPRLSITILEEAKENGIEYIFFQPGTYNDEVVAKAEELGLKFLTDDCVYATLKKGAH